MIEKIMISLLVLLVNSVMVLQLVKVQKKAIIDVFLLFSNVLIICLFLLTQKRQVDSFWESNRYIFITILSLTIGVFVLFVKRNEYTIVSTIVKVQKASKQLVFGYSMLTKIVAYGLWPFLTTALQMLIIWDLDSFVEILTR